MPYTYLLIDLLAISVPLIFSFHPRINLYRKWKALIPALLITATVFIIWDIYFTAKGVWSFNSDYLTGIQIANLPLEEILFFICIPYACVFTYYCISLWTEQKRKASPGFTISLIVLLISTATYYSDRAYTSVTFYSCAILLFYIANIRKAAWLGTFYFSCLFLLIPFFICNGILTGTGIESAIVRYNDSENMGIRFYTIPVEDTFYGMLMILMNVSLFEYFSRHKS